MPRGQFYTVFMLGFATALGFIEILAGVIACSGRTRRLKL